MMHPNNGLKVCEAMLVTDGNSFGTHPGDQCGASASFESRGHACCWVHYQADTAGPRAGKVEFRK